MRQADVLECVRVFLMINVQAIVIVIVLTGIDPAGCQIFGFKQPPAKEMEHDWLHRTRKLFPERGRFGVFNRSYYEETLVVRVHPSYLAGYGLTGKYADAPYTGRVSPHVLWDDRFESIEHMELHAARNNTTILKFFLNVSKAEQATRPLRCPHPPAYAMLRNALQPFR